MCGVKEPFHLTITATNGCRAGENATTQTRMHFRVENRKHKNNRRKRRKIYINKVRPVAGSIAALRGFDDIVHFKRLL